MVSCDDVAQTGAVGVVEHQEGDLLVAVLRDQRAERVALDGVRGSGAEVERRVAAQVDRGVGRRDLGDLVVGEGVDDVQRDAGGGGADDDGRLGGDQGPAEAVRDRHVGGVAGVLDVVAGFCAVDATRGVDVGDSQADARDLRGAEEGEVARQRQDAAHVEGVGAGLVALALVVGEVVGRCARLGLGGSAVSDGVSVSVGFRRAAVIGATCGKGQASTAVPAMSLTQVAVLDRFTG